MSATTGHGPDLAVVIPTYNRRDLLHATLHALTRQDVPTDRFEVVVADDGSTDDTSAVVRSFAGRLHVRYSFQEQAGFRAALARNAGARLCTAPVLVFLDTGAIVGPEFVRQHLAAHGVADPEPDAEPDGDAGRSDRRRDAVIGPIYGYRPYDPSLRLTEALATLPPERVVRRYQAVRSFSDWRQDEFAKVGYDVDRLNVPWLFFWSGNCSVRATDFWAVGGFDEGFREWGVEDVELGYRLFRHGLRFRVNRRAWAIEAPHPRDKSDNLRSANRNMGRILARHPDPFVELTWVLFHQDAPWPFADELYQAVGAWAVSARDLDVAAEIGDGTRDVPAGTRIVVIGCGGTLPPDLPPSTLVDFDEALLTRALADPRQHGHHALGLRTPLPDGYADLVVVTSRLRGLWPRWGETVLHEARRIGRVTRVPFLDGVSTTPRPDVHDDAGAGMTRPGDGSAGP